MGSCQSIAEVVTYGFIMRLMGSFQLWCIGLRVVAAKAVYELGFSTITRIEIGECGCIGPVIKMLGWYGSGGERSYSKGLIDFNIVSWVYEVFQEG